MQIDAGISEVNVVTFSGGAGRLLPERRCEPRSPASAEILRAVLSHSERLSGADPSQDAEAG